LHGAVISLATAKKLGLPTSTTQAISPAGAPALSEDEEKDLTERVSGLSPYADVSVERGFQESWTVILLALFGIGGLAVLIGTLTATALALNDAKPDFATLAAVGAAPRTRRWAAGSQALVLALLGTVLGVVVGFAPGLAVTWPLTAESFVSGSSTVGGPTIDIPWTMLLGLVVVVPLGAAAVATVFTRSRLTMVRRVAQ
ncbi:MAG: FtsX-like permease family protein, partial [Actinomycetales bacterium]